MVKQKLIKYLRENNRKYTIERDDMLEVIKSMDGTYSLADLYKQALQHNAIHAKSTIYRNINMFLDAGLIKTVENKETNKAAYQTSEEFFRDSVNA